MNHTPLRIERLLANAGYGSRREVQTLLRQNRVRINGSVARKGSTKAAPSDLSVDNEPLPFLGGMLLMMHKPCGVVCSHDSKEGQRIYDLLPERYCLRKPAPSTIGRLDKDTSGLILITDRGDWLQHLAHPKHGKSKTYEWKCDVAVPSKAIDLFASGTLLLHGEPKACIPAELSINSDELSGQIILHEGKYHQVRRMFASLGCTVTQLHRCAFGDLTLGSLEPSAFREVTVEEKIKLGLPQNDC